MIRVSPEDVRDMVKYYRTWARYVRQIGPLPDGVEDSFALLDSFYSIRDGAIHDVGECNNFTGMLSALTQQTDLPEDTVFGLMMLLVDNGE